LRVNPCGFAKLRNFSFPVNIQDPDSAVSRIVEEVLEVTGMHLDSANRNFYLGQSDEVQNAVAAPKPIVINNTYLIIHRFIICSPTFLTAVRASCSNAGVYTLLAHEISHHLNGDNFMDSNMPEARRQAELSADSFAGYLCYELSITRHLSLDSCLVVYQQFGDSADTDTHPKKETRIASFTNGWNTAKEYSKQTCEFLNAIDKNPQLAIQLFSGTSGSYVRTMSNRFKSAIAKQSLSAIQAIQSYATRVSGDTAVINLRGDELPLVQNSNNQLINGKGEALKDAKLEPMSALTAERPSFSDYVLDKKNVIWARYPNGVPYIAGYKRK
ncbi:MAG: hypothetical protein Q8938_01745, partial [Bacteroidota bacterium]|nr:hypothetical protein [Bacteroidota bacterium]